MPPELTPALIIAAANFAATKHRDQRRKGLDQEPYINHPLAVANILANEAGITDIETLCAAILHDVLEDTETSSDELRTIFGGAITSVVQELTDDRSLEKSIRKQHQVDSAAKKSFKARCVKIADKTSNLRDIITSPPQSWSGEQKIEYRNWALNVVNQMRGTHIKLETLFDHAVDHFCQS